MPVRIGDLLLKEHMISPQQLQDALNYAKLSGTRLSSAFVSLGFVKDVEITKAVSRQLGVPWTSLDPLEVDPAIIKIIPAETARKYQVLPLSCSNKTLAIALADPTNVFVIDELRLMTGFHVEPVVASESALEEAIDRCYGSALRERDDALARAAELESLLERPQSLSDDEEFIAEHLAEGRVFRAYGLVDKARAQFETVLERFPDNSEALGELHDLQQDRGEIAARMLRALAETLRLDGDTDESVNTRVSFAELLVNENMISLEQCLRALMDQKVNGSDLRTAIVRLGFAKDEEITSLLSRTSTGSP